ncbi:hypothetical protein [Rubricoccus marinus]|uniref:DUF4139 domain-containing protein n=1 Tax=Rubricoccus marinus TaxID=716817 RepID=A0A259TZA7_9BACT|nr:hypothetical protein [Rubricoccus marinus]OZC03113.1 hypothetical protein BSZ36_09090 [Rubricoccus marinus]
MRLRLALAALLLTPLASGAQPSADVPVKRVILFTSGVGYFEHDGRVSGDADLTLRFEQSALDDVIKSLVVEDQQGRVSEVVYPSQAPLERRLQAFAVDLSGVGGIASLLTQMRGAALEVETAAGTFRGPLASVDGPTGGENDPGVRLTILTSGGLRTIQLSDARRVEILDAELRAEVEGALMALAEGSSGERKPVTVRFRGSRQRPVKLGYVVESPVWKTTYRLVLPQPGEADGYLQGWAVVENPTESDWDDVRLELVSGRPISFEMDLYSPRYLQRPTVQIPDDASGVRPRTYEDGVGANGVQSEKIQSARTVSGDEMENLPARSVAGVTALRGGVQAPAPPPPAAEPLALDAGVVSNAQAGALGELFAYILDGISIPRRGSAMLPIVTDAIGTERLSVYTPGSAGRHPLRGARITNRTDKHLRGGPITVFDDGYAGDALLNDLGPGDDRLVTFAVDQDVLVDPVPGSQDIGDVQTATIADGVLRIVRERVRRTGYRIENRGERDRTVLVEHPRMSGGALSSLTAEETTPALYRLRVDVAPGEADTLVVNETAPLSETYALASQTPERILALVRTTSGLSPEARRMLERAAALAEDVATAQRRLNALQNERGEISRDQDRIRQNLQAVDSDTDYGRRLLAKLDQQESRLEQLDREIEQAQADLNRRQQALRDGVRGMNAR